ALVLVNTLYLQVEQRIGMDRTTGLVQKILRKPNLVTPLGRTKFGGEGRIVLQLTQLGQLEQMGAPARADLRIDQRRQRPVRLRKPTPRRNAVRDIREALRKKPCEFAEKLPLHQLRVQLRHTVDFLARDDRKMRHTHAALPV